MGMAVYLKDLRRRAPKAGQHRAAVALTACPYRLAGAVPIWMAVVGTSKQPNACQVRPFDQKDLHGGDVR
jgi:hypothetical protein